jgi:hypothetical protein
MVSRKADVNLNEFVERMSTGLPTTTQVAQVSRERADEASKNPFSPPSKPVFASSSSPRLRAQQVLIEDDGLQVVPSASTAARIWNQALVPRPLALSLKLSTGSGAGVQGVASVRKNGNPFTPRPSPDSEGLQAVSPITPGSRGWNTYPTPISLQTPLNPWSGGAIPALKSSGNPFRGPRYADAEGLQAAVSNLAMGSGEPKETGDSYAVSSPVNTNGGLRVPLPYPVTPELRNSQPALRWGAPWAPVFQNAFPNACPLPYPENYPVQSSSEFMVGGRTNISSPNDEILIAVFGMTGTGKTTFIEKVSGQKLNVGHNLHSCSSLTSASHAIRTPNSHFKQAQ